MRSEATSFKGRRAYRLSNDLLELMTLPGGGHIAELRLAGSTVNPLWEPHWRTIEPEEYDRARHLEYGTEEGRLLASIAGHTLCLNHYVMLSAAELEADGLEDGEAPNLPWEVYDAAASPEVASISYGLNLPEAGMQFSRRIELRAGEPVAHFEEEVTNLRRTDSPLGYQQHVALGSPMVEPGVTRLDLSGAQGHTSLSSFGEADPTTPNQSFTWPNGPGLADLDVFPTQKPLCCVCTVANKSDDGMGFVAVSNPRVGLLLAYVFSADTFPWTALWYENGGSDYPPYDRRTVAWGIEFGTCALPLERMELLSRGPLLGRRPFGVLPALTTLRTAYTAILHPIPEDWRGVRTITRSNEGFIVTERGQSRELTIASGGPR